MIRFCNPRWSFIFFFIVFLFMAACGQSGTESGAGKRGGVAAVPVGIRLMFAEGAARDKQKLSAISPGSITSVRLAITADGIEPISHTEEASPGSDVRMRLDLPTGQELNIVAEILDSAGRILYFGREKTVIRQSRKITLIIDRPITISTDLGTVPTGSTSTVTITLSDAFLEGLEGASIIWSIEGNADEIKGTITPDQADPTTAIYTAPENVPESAQVEITAASGNNPDVFETVILTVIPSEKSRFVKNEGVDSPDCGKELAPCKTITKALSFSEPGDIVLVQAGTYHFSSEGANDSTVPTEQAPLVMKPGVQLIGSGADDTFLDIFGTSAQKGISIIGADDATLSGFTITDKNSALDYYLLETNHRNMKISDNIFLAEKTCIACATASVAIRVFGGGSPTITGNTFGLLASPLHIGIEVEGTAAPRISDNTFSHNFIGIEMSENSAPLLTGNLILENSTGVSVRGSSTPDLGSPSGSSGKNILSCNTTADLANNTSHTVMAQNNQWDHVPPRMGFSGVSSNEESDITILPIDSTGGGVDVSGATLYPFAPCNIGITVDPLSGLFTSEGGQSADFSIFLNTQPSSEVNLQLSSSKPSEGTVSLQSLTFTSANWHDPQGVTVTGVDDPVADGDVPYQVQVVPESLDLDYNGPNKQVQVSLTNLDNDFQLTVRVTGKGTVTSNPGRISCPTTICTAVYREGTEVTLTARPDPLHFVDWGGDCLKSNSLTIIVRITASKSCSASFPFVR